MGGGRARGTVVDHFYREPGWPPAHWAPYQVQLDNGGLIFVPTDQDQCVRLARGAPDSLRWPRRGERRRCPRALPLRGVFPEFPNIRLTPMSCCLRSLLSHLYLLHLPCRPPCSTCLAAPLAPLALPPPFPSPRIPAEA